MLDAKIASALNKITKNSYFKKQVSLEEQKAQKEDRFLRGRQFAYMIPEYFQVTGAHGTVLDYGDLFTITLRNDANFEYVSLINSKPYWNCMTWKFIRKYIIN